MRLRGLWIVATFLFVLPVRAEQVNVAAASDLNAPIKEIIQQFEKETEQKVRLTLGSSGNFFAQIQNGAPFDIFLSADVNYPKQLEKSGQAVPGSTFVYGLGQIVLWTSKALKIDVNALGMKALLGSSVKKISIANPEHAPYGRAAVAAMQSAKVYDAVKDKLVLGENISQAAQFAQSRAAEVGIIALSIALTDAMQQAGTYWIVPREAYPPLEQGVVLLKHGGAGAKAFYDWLKSARAAAIFEKYGFRK